MRFELVPRTGGGGAWRSLLSPVIALAITAAVGAAIFAALGLDPLSALRVYFIDPLKDIWSIHEIAIKAAPLILIAVGLAACYRANVWNIGAEGQLIAGAIAAGSIPILMPGLTGPLVLPLMLVLAMLGGAAWASIPAVLKVRFGASEILVSLMLVYVASLLLDYLVRGPWRNPEGFNFPETADFSTDARLPEILAMGEWGGRANWGIVIAIVVAIATAVLLARTLKGFEISVGGESPRAARFAGFDTRQTTVFVFLFSGALAGLAGAVEVAGAIGELRPTISPGYGFTAIIVAFLGRLNPIGIIFAGFLLALSYIGGEAAQIELGLSDKTARVFQGVLLFSVLASDTLVRYRVRISRSVRALPAAAPR